MPLPRFRINSSPGDYVSIVTDVLTGRAHSGEADRDLESAVMAKTGSPYAVCMAKARVGIYMTVRAIIKPGQKVICSPYTISDVINMIICAGGIPVFGDIDRPTANITPKEVEALITRETGAVLITHLHGCACDIAPIAQLCQRWKVPLIEDAAQAFGTYYKGRHVGTFGDAGIFSFGMYKNVNSFFGGMVITPHAKLHDQLRAEVKSFPWQETGYYLSKVQSGLTTDVATFPPLFSALTFPMFRYGYVHDIKTLNGMVSIDVNPEIKRELPESYLRRYTPLQAKLALHQIDRVDAASDLRIAFAEMYVTKLADISDLIIPPLRKDRSHTYTYFTIQPPDRVDLVKYMMQRGCDLAPSHYKNCADLPCFKEFYRDCPNARATAQSLIYLPNYSRYSRHDVLRNIQVIRDYFSKSDRH